MTDTLLLELLRKLETRERSRFRELVDSPFFNKNTKLRKLCHHLLTYAPDFQHPDLDKQIVHRKVFGKQPYRDLAFNNLVSDLLQLCYQFLSVSRFQSQPEQELEELCLELLDRDLPKQVGRQMRRWKLWRAKRDDRSYDYFHKDYLRHEKLDQLSLIGGQRKFGEDLQEQSDALDRYFFINKLRIACDMTSRNAVVNAGYKCHFLEEIRRYQAMRPDLAGLPLIQVYSQALQMLEEPREAEHYYRLKELLAEHRPIIPKLELRILYNYALNVCVRQINIGRSDFYREIWELYKLLLSEGILLKNGQLSQWSYSNIITSAMRLGAYDWTEEFIRSYRDFLPEEVRENAYVYNLASLYFEKGDYTRALHLLLDVEFTDAFYHLSAKIIQLKVYFQLQETEPFFSLIEATRHYITRNRQLSEYQKRSNSNFLKLASRLFQQRLKKDWRPLKGEERDHFQAAVEQTQPLANKGWLLEML
jgi:hypothetical protein